MNLQPLLTPANFTLAAGVAGGVFALALLGLLIAHRRSFTTGVSLLWRSIFSQGGLFYLGMALFMLASVVEAGPVLNQIVMHGALFGYGGQLLVFAFDMIAAVSLRARLNARRVFDTRGMKLQMWGIWLPALVSVAANLAGAIQHFNAADFNHLFIFAWLLPLIGAVFPSMIVVLSLAADHLIDSTAITTKIDVDEFRQQERKRIDILKVRLSTEQELLEEEQKIAVIRSARDQATDAPRREWVFLRWLRQETTPPLTMITATVEQAVNEAREQIAQQTNAQLAPMAAAQALVQQTLAAVSDQLAELATAQQILTQQVTNHAHQLHSFTTFRSQLEGVASLVEGQQQQLLSFSSHIEGLASTLTPLLTFTSQVETMASTVDALTTAVEALKVNQTDRILEGSKNEGSKHASRLNLQPLAGGSSEGSSKAVASSGEPLTTSLEAMKVNQTARSVEGSTRAGQVNLQLLANPSVEGSVEGVSEASLKLHESGEMNLSKKELAFLFIADYQRKNAGAEPTLEEMMAAVDCSQGSASNYRSEYRKGQEGRTGAVAVLVEASNGHMPNGG